ncbi:MAG: serine/threonine protein kinase [Gammaproteobacteria bacterium]|nr:serine/threonine protein kinase [Gammaproteobacteria bacterium]
MFESRNLLARFQSYTAYILLAALLISFFNPRFDWLNWVDDRMFSLGSHLLPAPEAIDDIRLIKIPDDALHQPESITQLRSLLRKLYRAKPAGVAVLSDHLPAPDYQLVEADKKSEKTPAKDSKSNHDEPAWEFTRGEITKLAWMLENYHIDVGLSTHINQIGYYSRSAIPTDSLFEDSPLRYIPAALLPEKSYLEFNLEKDQFKYKRLPYYAQSSNTSEKPLLWYDMESGAVIPDLALSLYLKLQHKNEISWREGVGIQLSTRFIKTNLTGHVFEYYSAATGNSANAESYALEEALNHASRNFKNRIVIIGSDISQLENVANRVTSLITAATYHSPLWFVWVKNLVLVVIMLYLLLLLPRVQSHTGYLLSFILLLVGIMLQYGLLITEGFWLSLSVVYVYLLLGHSLIHVVRLNESRMDRLKLQTHDALWHLARYQYEQGDHDKALPNLLKCKPTADVLELLYEIGLSFERRRQYDKALHLFSEIKIRKADFKDVKKRLKALTNVSGAKTEVISSMTATKTLVIPDTDLQLPVLGRYEIEKELGRGAMGVVYLGRDPKINRQVAIKTLDYSQLSKNEIKTIKSRFFREAEAAGRLSHPNIVTVYDVGDEEDFAFIAMDFVEGVSLGEHTSQDRLLPIREVYQIAATVAETLDYAHAQNIVHRDIKPGNIMYNPETGQTKITDFGIARITDSVRTRTGSFMGSPSYMAPEQMTGSNVDGRADIYALGASFYQLLTGQLPFDADSLGNLAYKITHEKHRSIRDLRPELPASATRIVNKALQKKPDKRYATGDEMAKAIIRGMPKGDNG